MAENAAGVMAIVAQNVLVNQLQMEHLGGVQMEHAQENAVLDATMNVVVTAEAHAEENAPLVHVQRHVVADVRRDVEVVSLLVVVDARKTVMDVAVAVQEHVVTIVVPLAVMHVLFNAEINVKQLVEHLVMKNVKIVAKLIVMILVNQLMRLLVQIIHQQTQRPGAEKIALLDVMFIVQDVLVIALV